MSKKVAPRVQLNFAPEEEIIQDELPEPDMPDMPVDMPEVIEHEEIVENDIFDLKKKEHLEELIIDEPLPQTKSPEIVMETPRPRTAPAPKPKKKRQLSEEHKAKLALAREKALVTRRKKAEEKKKMKEIENKTKELKKKKAQKDLEQLEDEVINNKPHNNSKSSTTTTSYPTSMITRKDLEEAQLDAIMKYEAIRKARKEEKKKVQMIEQQKKDLQKKIQGYGARDTNGRLLNKWDRCY